MSRKYDGLIAATYSPMNCDGSINLDAVEPMANMLARNGVKAAFISGSTGESVSLTGEERNALTRRWVEAAPPELPVMVHVGHNSIPVAAALAAEADKAGAAAVAAMPPSFFRPADIGMLVECMRMIADAAPRTPFYYYHIPPLTGVDLPMAEFLPRAAEKIPTFAGIKFSSKDLVDFQFTLETAGDDYDVFFGCDEWHLAGLSLGARAAVGSTYCFAAPLYLRIRKALESGDLPGAQALQRKSAHLVMSLAAINGNFHAASKCIMALVGVDCGQVRPPLKAMTPEQREEVRRRLDAVGFDDYCCR